MTDELPFHQVMRASTVEAHDRANASPYMAALFDGALEATSSGSPSAPSRRAR